MEAETQAEVRQNLPREPGIFGLVGNKGIMEERWDSGWPRRPDFVDKENSFKIFFKICMYTYGMCAFINLCVLSSCNVHGGQKGALDCPELELQVVGS